MPDGHRSSYWSGPSASENRGAPLRRHDARRRRPPSAGGDGSHGCPGLASRTLRCRTLPPVFPLDGARGRGVALRHPPRMADAGFQRRSRRFGRVLCRYFPCPAGHAREAPRSHRERHFGVAPRVSNQSGLVGLPASATSPRRHGAGASIGSQEHPYAVRLPALLHRLADSRHAPAHAPC